MSKDKTSNKSCYVCKTTHNTSNMVYYINRWFCPECLKEWLQTEEGQRDRFIDYIWHLYDKEYRNSTLYFQLLNQAEKYHRQGMKYSGMLIAAKYHIDTLEKKWYNNYGLGQLLPQTYEELKRMYESQKKITETLRNKDSEITERKVVARKKPVSGKVLSLE